MIDFFKMVKDEKLAEIFKILRQSDFDINQQDDHGKTALHFALNLQIIKILIASGSDVNIADRKGKTPLDYAPNDKVRQILLEHGAEHGTPIILKEDADYTRRQDARDKEKALAEAKKAKEEKAAKAAKTKAAKAKKAAAKK